MCLQQQQPSQRAVQRYIDVCDFAAQTKLRMLALNYATINRRLTISTHHFFYSNFLQDKLEVDGFKSTGSSYTRIPRGFSITLHSNSKQQTANGLARRRPFTGAHRGATAPAALQRDLVNSSGRQTAQTDHRCGGTVHASLSTALVCGGVWHWYGTSVSIYGTSVGIYGIARGTVHQDMHT